MNKVPKGYKQTEVGVIPEDWDVKKIKFVAPLQRGFDLPTSQLNEGIYPVVYSNGIGNYHNSFMAKAPGVVTGRSGTLGKVSFIIKDYWPHNTSLWVTKFFENFPLFIYYLLIRINLEKFGTGSGVPTLNRNDVHDFKVPIPPLEEQSAIAEALSDVDALISSLDELIVKKRNIKQGAMQELLTGKRRLPGFSGKWEEEKLVVYIKVKHGKNQYEVSDENGLYPILATGGIIGMAKSFLYNKPSVLIGRKGTIDVPRYMDMPFWTIDTLFYTEISDKAEPKFIYYKFKLINWYSHNEASGVPSLNASKIENIETVFPPTLEEQSAIAAVLSDMDAEIEQLVQKRDKYKQVKQGMMQELLTGKIRLIKD